MCGVHGGRAGQVRAKAAIRAELHDWKLTDATIDPGEALLRLVTQSAARAQRYAEELQAKVEEHGLEKAVVGEAYGEGGKQGEYIRGLAKLEAEERDRLANFASKAIAAGLAERQVRLAERQGELMVAMVAAALAEVGLPDEVAQRVRQALARQARELAPALPNSSSS